MFAPADIAVIVVHCSKSDRLAAAGLLQLAAQKSAYLPSSCCMLVTFMCAKSWPHHSFVRQSSVSVLMQCMDSGTAIVAVNCECSALLKLQCHLLPSIAQLRCAVSK
jgi:hypothetical protein